MIFLSLGGLGSLKYVRRVETDIITTSDLRQDIAEWTNISQLSSWNISILRSDVLLVAVITAWDPLGSVHKTAHMLLLFICTPVVSLVTGESVIQLQPTRHLVFLLPATPPARISQSTYGAPTVRYLIINFSWTCLFAQSSVPVLV